MKYGNNLKHANQQRYSVVDIFTTDGRIGRQAYFFYSIILPAALLLVLGSIAGLISKLGGAASSVSYVLLAASVVTVLLLVVHLTIQRCHDFNTSGWFSVFAIIPFANIIFALIPGNNGLNSFGESPEPPSLLIKIAAQIIAGILITLTAYGVLHLLGKV